jgi:hypothetical protein
VTVEANPETVSFWLARLLGENGVTRISLGAESFQSRLLDVLERRRRLTTYGAVHARRGGFDNVSLDLVYGIPGQSAATSADSPKRSRSSEHLSCYELGRSRHAVHACHGVELERQADAMEGTSAGGGYAHRRRHAGTTANFALTAVAGGRDLGLGTTSATGSATTTWVSASAPCPRSTATGRRTFRASRATSPRWRRASHPARARADRRRDAPARFSCSVSGWTSRSLTDVAGAVDHVALTRLADRGLVELSENGRGPELRLTPRGRFLGDAVTAELLVA